MVEAYFDLLKMLNVILFLRIKSGFVKRSNIFLACFDSNCKCNVVYVVYIVYIEYYNYGFKSNNK